MAGCCAVLHLSEASVITQPLQEVLNPFALIGAHWTKSALVVDEDDMRPLKGDDHVGLLVAIDIEEAHGHRNKICVRAVELRADVDAGVAGVPTWQFNDLNTPVQVDR